MTRHDFMRAARLCVVAMLLLGWATATSLAGPATQPTAKAPEPWYANETWDEARVLTWARPGVSGNAWEPANWLEEGRPAMEPPDEDTDIVFPDAEKSYAASFGDYVPFKARHITVGANAHAKGYGITTTGNIHVKEGGSISGKKPCNIVGTRHTFVRNDNKPGTAAGETRISQYILVTKYKGASVEFLGYVTASDELRVNEGTAIVGADSSLRAGAPSVQDISPEGRLILLSGSFFGKHSNNARSLDDVWVKGVLQAGTHQRPLTKDATLGISFKVPQSKGQAAGGLRVEKDAQVVVHSTDPARHRLRIQFHTVEKVGRDGADYSKADKTFGVVILGEQKLNGVLFDHICKGGIQLANPAVRAQWKNVFFGDHNAAPPDGLFSRYAEPKAGGAGSTASSPPSGNTN